MQDPSASHTVIYLYHFMKISLILSAKCNSELLHTGEVCSSGKERYMKMKKYN